MLPIINNHRCDLTFICCLFDSYQLLSVSLHWIVNSLRPEIMSFFAQHSLPNTGRTAGKF